MTDYSSWEDNKYLKISEVAKLLDTEIEVIEKIYIEAFVETYVHQSGVLMDIHNGDFISTRDDLNFLDGDISFNPKYILVRSDVVEHIRQMLLSY